MPHILKAYNSLLNKVENVRAVENALLSMPYEVAEIHNGYFYTHHAQLTVAASAVHNHIIVVGSLDIDLLAYDFAATVGPGDIFLYENTFVDVNSYGTQPDMYNRNRTAVKVPTTIMRSQPYIDVNSIGDLLEYKLIPESSGGNNKEVGGSSSSREKWILKAETNYLIRYVNNDASNAGTVDMSLTMVDKSEV